MRFLVDSVMVDFLEIIVIDKNYILIIIINLTY